MHRSSLRPTIFIVDSEQEYQRAIVAKIQASVAKAKTAPRRAASQTATLLRVLRRVKANKEEMLLNISHPDWAMIGNYFYGLQDSRYMGSARTTKHYKKYKLASKVVRSSPVGSAAMMNMIKAHITAVAFKMTGLTFHSLSHRETSKDPLWAPQQHLKSYKINNSTDIDAQWSWVSTQYFEQCKRNKMIVWCPVDKNWWWYDYMKTVYSLNKKKEITSMMMSPQSNLEACPVCHKWWIKGYLLLSPVTEMKGCPSCGPVTPKKNQVPRGVDDVMGGYHSHHTTWQYQIQRTGDSQDFDTIPMGIEVEVQPIISKIDTSSWCYNLFKFQQQHNAEWNNMYFERDGSLSDTGVECVTNPMTLDFHKQYWAVMLPEMRKEARGWNLKDTDSGAAGKSYGIHITSNRKYWGELGIVRLQKFLAAEENNHFAKAIAQRTINYNSHQLGAMTKEYNKVTSTFKLDPTTKKIMSNGRTGQINVKGDLIEIRSFASTLNQESFMKNLEFVDSFQQYCRQTAFNINYKVYLQWLMSKASHLKRYSNLISFLHRKRFAVRGSITVVNEWEDLLKFRPSYLKKPIEFTPNPIAAAGADPEDN